MGGFVDPFIPSPAWPQDMVFAGTSWGGNASSLAGSSAQAMEFHVRNGSSPTLMNGGRTKGLAGATVFPAGDAMLSPAKLQEQLLQQQSDDLTLTHGLDFAVDAAGTLGSILGAPPCPLSLTDSAPLICSSNESSGSEQSGAGGLPHFLVGEQTAAWPPAAYASIPSMAGEETSGSFGFGGISGDDLLHEAAACTPNGKNRFQQLGAALSAQLQLHWLQDDAEFNAGKLLSFAPGQRVTPSIDTLQMNQKEFSRGLHHLNLSSLVPGPPLAPFDPKQSAEDSSGKNGNGVAGNGAAPKPRVRARRGQATDPHSIAERLRREKISDRMKNLQELVPNSNKTDKASMLEEIIEYIKFLQLQTKVLSMSRLGATEAVVPLLTESQNESSGLLLSPRSRSAGRGGLAAQSVEPREDSAALEQEVAQLMENNMTAAMQYLQSKGLCLMPIGLASAISTQKGTSSAAVRPESRGGATAAAGGSGNTDDVKRALDAPKPLRGSAKGTKSKMI